MPTRYFFSPSAVDSQPIATVLQRHVLGFLAPEDLSFVAKTSPTLNRLLTQSEPTPSMEFHPNWQVFRERRGIINGYKDLQQSTLPAWLKQRWSTKANMLTVISQAVISLERDDYIPKAQQHKPVDFALALTEAMPKFIINIYRNDRVVAAQPIIDTISLHALLTTHTLQLLLNGQVIDNKELALAALELTEIFLTSDCQATLFEGLQAVYEDLRANGPLINTWLSDNGMMRFRNHSLAIEVSDYFANLQDDDCTEEENAAVIKKLSGCLTNPHLLLMLRENHLSIEQINTIDNAPLIACLASRNGLIALRQKYFNVEFIDSLLECVLSETVLALLKGLLSDVSLQAFEQGLIRFDNLQSVAASSIKSAYVKPDQAIVLEQPIAHEAWICMVMRALLLTPVANNKINDLSINKDGITTFQSWQELLTTLIAEAALEKSLSVSARP